MLHTYLMLILIFSFPIVYAEPESFIPNWIKTNAEFWTGGQISNLEFLSSIQYLIDNDILQVKGSPEILEKFEELKDKNKQVMIENRQIQNELDNITKKYDSLNEKYQDEIILSNKLINAYKDVDDEYQNYKQEVNTWMQDEESKPFTTIYDQTINWHMIDSKGNVYDWSYLVEDYEYYVIAERYSDQLYFESDNGETFTVLDHTKYVETSFSDVIDEVYENSIDDEDFMYEVWYLTSQLTTYSYDIGEYPRWAVETLSRGGGDCEDTTILILDMLMSSKYTKNWEFEMLYFDAYNTDNPNEINHIVPVITIGDNTWIIESTAKSYDGMNQWNDVTLNGWWIEV